MPRRVPDSVMELATRPYLRAGRFAWHFARGKLSGDPIFTAFLNRHLIPDGARVLDLGCGQGLLIALLQAAECIAAQGQWQGTHAPAKGLQYRGIELVLKDVLRARAALGAGAHFTCGDICSENFGSTDVAVILDVLHYVDYAAQDAILTRVRAALQPGGRLLLRISDAKAGLPFIISTWVDRIVTLVRRHYFCSMYCRPLSAWIAHLQSLGFAVNAVPMGEGRTFANVLLIADLP